MEEEREIDTGVQRLSKAHIGAPLVDWLVAQALPVWSRLGVDKQAGGFFEKLDLQRRPVDEPRRARVVARQIYVFATAARRGWLRSADELVEHGLRFLLHKMRLADGTFAASVRPDGEPVQAGFDLYEHAFVLFALAAARRGRPDRQALDAVAADLLASLRSRWSHPLLGFEEAVPRSLPLKSNPHMHLLEASLEWVEVSSGSARAAWQALADDLVRLCLNHLIDARSGALHEYFDGDWRRAAGRLGGAVEPGHQFEWAWLLMREPVRTIQPRALAAAQRLLQVGEEYGVDRLRGVAVNELDAALAVTDGAAKLWPQTERVKAWHAAAALAGDGDETQARQARHALSDAVRGLSRYWLDAPPGLWREQLNVDGRFALQDCRASSLYHIVCAIDTLTADATATPVGAGLPSPVSSAP